MYDLSGRHRGNKYLQLLPEELISDSINRSEITPELLYYICNYFNINLVMIDEISIAWSYPGSTLVVSDPMLIIYKSDDNIYHAVMAHPVTKELHFPYVTSSILLPSLEKIDTSSIQNLLQSHITTKTNQDVREKILNIPPEVTQLESLKKQLTKLTAIKLRAMATEHGISIVKDNGKGSHINKLKAELIDDLITYIK